MQLSLQGRHFRGLVRRREATQVQNWDGRQSRSRDRLQRQIHLRQRHKDRAQDLVATDHLP